jgi:WD40 repeat protein
MEFETALEVADEAVFLKVGRRLTPVEVAILRGSWQRQTYDQIAEAASYSANYLKLDVGPKLWKLLSDTLGEPVSKTTLPAALERQWRKQYNHQVAEARVGKGDDEKSPDRTVAGLASPLTQMPQIDWGEAPDISVFYGREAERETLGDWLMQDGCRLVALLGMGGIGKSSLAAKIAHDLQAQFEAVIWRSLRNAPQLEPLLAELVAFLSQQQDTQATLPRLLHWLRSRRCLVILDNVETILQAGDQAGHYLVGYEPYGDLFRSLGEAAHQSCVILTSREKPAEMAAFEGEGLRVRSLPLLGSWEAALAILEAKGLTGMAADKRYLCEFYNCSPLALKIVSSSIRSLFDGDIAAFLSEETMVFNGVRRLLQQQFERLSELEQTIMYWLAINRQWTSTTELMEDIVPIISRASLLEALESLTWRSLVEIQSGKYTQQPVVMEYVTDCLIQKIATELITIQLSIFGCYALIKTNVLDYIRETQVRLILHPVSDLLATALQNPAALESHLQSILQEIHHLQEPFFGYGVGNLINLMLHLQLDLTGYDFSQSKVRQAYLQDCCLHYSNFTQAYFRQCVFTQTLGAILAVALDPSDTRLAAGDINGTVRLWQAVCRHGDDLDLDQPLLTLIGHKSWILSLDWHPDGQQLLSSSDDGTLKLWDVQTGTCLRTFQEHQKPVWRAVWSPDGQQIASCSSDHSIKIWRVETGDCLQTWQAHHNTVWSVDWSPDGKKLASGSDDQTIRVWDVESGQCVGLLVVEGYWVRCVAWNPDGSTLASASSDQRIGIWDVQTGQQLRTLAGHTAWIYALRWSGDGATLASCSGDGTIKLWDPLRGNCLKTLQGHQDPVWDLSWSSDSKTLVSGSYDQTVRLWKAETAQCIRTVKGYINWIRGVTWSPDGKTLASGSTDKTIKLWDAATGHCLMTLVGHQGWVFSVDWSPSQPVIASSSTDATIKLWDARTGQCLRTLRGHASWIWSVAWSPDGQLLASGSSTNDLTIRLWNPNSGECLKVLSGHQSWIWWVVWSSDGQHLATAGNDQVIKLWDVQTGACWQTLQDDSLLGVAIGWSPDGRQLATSSTEHAVMVWDVQTGQCLRSLVGHQALIWAIGWSADGKWLASGGDDCTIRLWNLDNQDCVATLSGHQGRILAIVWNPDGHTFVLHSAGSSTEEIIFLTGRTEEAQDMCL